MGGPRTTLGVRLRRMLAMVPWLLAEGGSTVSELADHFGMEENEVVRDLELVMCCGVPPYGGGDLITLALEDDGSVLAWPGPFLSRPMQLTSDEAFAVLAAGRALVAVPGSDQGGALAAALAKLEAALGDGGGLEVELEPPARLEDVRAAAERHEALEITYYSSWRDELTERIVEPWFVHAIDGRWYLDALDRASGERRRFRIDRVRSARATGERFDRPHDVVPPRQAFVPGPEAREVTVVLPSSAQWVVETYDPAEVAELPDGRLRVRLPVAGERWLERLLLRVGPDAVVEEPKEWRQLAAGAARRLLTLYQR